jgi:RNA polymerase sigma-70 factor (ECF subfamily)
LEPAPDTDHALMQRIARHDAGAYRLLVARHLNFCVRFAERMLGSRADAEDVAQEVCLRIWNDAEKWKPEAKFTTWLYRVMTNACIDHKRKRRLLPLGDNDMTPDTSPGPELSLQQQQRSRQVQAALGRLPPRQRAAVVLSYYEELSNEQAAAATGMTLNAFQQLLYRARQSLKDELIERESKDAQA